MTLPTVASFFSGLSQSWKEGDIKLQGARAPVPHAWRRHWVYKHLALHQCHCFACTSVKLWICFRCCYIVLPARRCASTVFATALSQWRSHTSGVKGVPPHLRKIHIFFGMWLFSVIGLRVKHRGCANILGIGLSRASIDSKRILHTMCASPLLYFLLTCLLTYHCSFNHSGRMICHDVFWLYGRLGRAAEREWTERNATDWRTPCSVKNFWLRHWSVCHKSAFYQNRWTDRIQIFQHGGFFDPVL